MADPKAFDEFCWITITPEDGTNREYGAYTSDIDITLPEKGIEILQVNTGQIVKKNRPEQIEVSFSDVIRLGPNEWEAPFEATSGTNTFQASLQRQRFRIVLLWANKTPSEISSAAGEVSNCWAKRLIIKDAYFTTNNPNWADQILRGDATFIAPFMDETGGTNYKWQHLTGSGTLTALDAYTGGNFG